MTSTLESDTMIRWLQHSKIRLALHCLRDAPGPILLVLHGLGQHARSLPAAELEAWPGAIHGLDFTGHGLSDSVDGGGYTCEVLMADADIALEQLGSATIYGRGLGAYVALLLAGARPEQVHGAILCDGPGLAGGGPRPTGPVIHFPDPNAQAPPDPFAMVELARDLRPPDYATEYVRQALEGSRVDPPLIVSSAEDPDWLRAVAEVPGVERIGPDQALSLYADEASRLDQGSA